MLKLRPFQRRAVKALESGRYDVIVMSLPRAQGKSSLAAELCYRALTPGDVLYRKGTESWLVASTIGQSRKTCFKLLRKLVEAADPDGKTFKVSESANACHVRRRACNTRVSVVAPSAKATLGAVDTPLVIVDEPASYELDAGAALWGSLSTALGKPDSPLRLFVIGHLAPKATAAGHWFYDLVQKGTRGRTWVYAIQGDPEKWDRASELRRCSPLSWSFPASRAKLLEQRDDARSDPRVKADLLSYRLNVPTPDESTVPLTVSQFKRICARDVPAPEGRPIVGLDLGGGRAWSCAVAVWPNGRTEALACAPGIPDVKAQEKRDDVPPGTYAGLVEAGTLHVADGFRIPPVAMLVGLAAPWLPRAFVCDRWRLDELRDAKVKVPILPRIPRWKEATADLRGLRKLADDGPLAIDPASRSLLKASLAVSRVESDDVGNTKLLKQRSGSNRARDDVVAAWILAAGAVSRSKPRRPARAVVCGG